MQLKYLAKVYAWYFRKLESVGLLSNSEKDEEDMLLNPAKIEEIEQRKREKKEVARLELMDELNIEASERAKFDKRERTVHKDIAPAKDRINDYKRKCFGRLFNGLQAARDGQKEEVARPGSSATSLAFADMTTQAQSVFEEEERASYSLPFSKFYTNNEQPVLFRN